MMGNEWGVQVRVMCCTCTCTCTSVICEKGKGGCFENLAIDQQKTVAPFSIFEFAQ